MSTTITDLKNAINTVRFNPAAIQRHVFDTLEAVTNGSIDLVDPSNPFVFLLEASAVLTAAQIEENENLTRRLYPSMALTEQELYLHMSDFDYMDRFATPARTTFTLLLNKEEFTKRAVQTDNVNIKKITIPRNTEFKVSDYTFTMEYPIDIRLMTHGGIQVVYDTTLTSPLQTLESNVVDWSIVRLKSESFIQLKIPVFQWVVSPQYAHINKSTSYIKVFPFKDQFYYCRVYRAAASGWSEIRTTHTDQVFDPNEPTAVLTVFDQRLQVAIPHVYLDNGTLDRELRIDIYTTKGPLDVLLDGYALSEFSANWRDINKQSSQYSAPLNVFTSMGLFSDSAVTGGSNALSLETLRERVIMNALGNMQLPITDQQLSARLSNLGYQSIRDVDNITNRIYLAARRLPQPTQGRTTEAAGCLLSTIQRSFNDLNAIRGVNTHYDWNRITITSDTLYTLNNGVIDLIDPTTYDQLYTLAGTALLDALNTTRYLTTPFYYVLDANPPYFNVRAYDLDYPSVVHREFIEENTTTLYTVATKTIGVHKKHNGYLIQITAQVSTPFKDIAYDALKLQIGFKPTGEDRAVFINATLKTSAQDNLQDQYRVFDCYLNSTFDIDDSHSLLINNAKMYPNEVRRFGLALEETLTLTYSVNELLSTPQTLNLTHETAAFLFNEPQLLLTREQARIRFGTQLIHFWEHYRTVVDSVDYELYTENVPKLYSENVYVRNPRTGTVELSMDDEGTLQYTVLHRQGDPMLDADGAIIYAHRIGDVKLDEQGRPVIRHPRGLLREWGMFFIDARYRFVSSAADIAYRAAVNHQILHWLQQDMEVLAASTLEQTTIYLYPLQTIGMAKALIGDRELRYVELEQTLTVRFFVDTLVYENQFIRGVLKESALQCVSEALNAMDIQVNQIIRRLTEQAGDNAIAIEVTGLGGLSNLVTLNLQDKTSRCSLAKQLTQRSDGVYELVDALNIEFIKLST